MNGQGQKSLNASVGPLETAVLYTQRGWSVVPVPHQSKNPGTKGWPQLRLTEADLPQHFNCEPQNIGVLLGEPSGWLIDIDLDHPRAVELADQYLPSTPAVFGRPGNPRSHWIFRASGPLVTTKHKSKSAGMIVELRSTGAQTIFPPSTHESGEAITWEDDIAEPALVDPVLLQEVVKELATAVLVELGEKTPPRKKAAQQKSSSPSPMTLDAGKQLQNCVASMLRMRMADSNDGSGRLFAAACRTVEHNLTDLDAVAAIREYSSQRPFPRDWTDSEILQRVRDAEKTCERGAAASDDNLIALGCHDPASGRLVLSPKRTLPTAQAFVREFHAHREGRTLHNYAGLLFAWKHNRYGEVEEEAVKKRLQLWLHQAMRYIEKRRSGETELIDFDSNPATVKAALESIRSYTHLPVNVTSPSWLGAVTQRLSPDEILACRSTLLHLPTMRRLDPTPAFFTTSALDFDPDPKAGPPVAWLDFLHQLFDDDIESHNLLQEWAGYCLTGDTSQQKMLLMVGPRRSGKGTIARVLARLIGTDNVCGPTTSSLAGPFGLQPLIGKSLAIVSDARFTGESIATVVERLLCISGEDNLTIDRKFLSSVTMKLATRFMFLTNELPRLNDSSGALAGRFVVLRTTQSFYGREDATLTDRLMGELPGILNWAIEGWRRLRERGRFVMPQSVADAVRDMEDLSSPVGAFVRENCVVGSGHRVDVDVLYAAWKRWCDSEGRTIVSTKPRFGRDLSAAVHGVNRRRRSGDVPFYDGIRLKETRP